MSAVPMLFQFSSTVLNADVTQLSFSTPLGRMVLGIEVNGVELPPLATYYDDDRSIAVWSAPIRFELLLTPAAIKLPPGMSVAGAWAAVWRIRSTKGMPSTVIK